VPGFDETQRWIVNNGFAVVIAILLLFLLRYVIVDAVAHFNKRLDTATVEQSTGFRDVAAAIRDQANATRHLDNTLDRLAEQASANHEAISTVLLFISHTQQEVVAHRVAIEGTSATVPSPPMQAVADDRQRQTDAKEQP
jgi:uncharacterized membrane protein YccC